MTPNAPTGPRKNVCLSFSLLFLALFTLSSLAKANPVISSTTLPSAAQGKSYSTTIPVSGGHAPYRFSIVRWALPAGLTMSSSGTISGTPTVSGAFIVRVLVIDSYSLRLESTLSLAVSGASTSSVGVSVSPTSASVSSAGTKQFSALVSGTSNTSVTWSTST